MKSPDKEYTEISSTDLKDWIAEEKQFTLVDTLINDHFNKVHIPTSKNACVFEVTFLDQISELVAGKNTEIVLYGLSENTLEAITAAEKLIRAGYTNVSVFQGGLMEWKEVDFRLEGEDPDVLDEVVDLPELRDRIYKVNSEISSIGWIGRNPNIKHWGVVDISGGEVSVKNGNIAGKCEIDMKTIRNINLEGDPLQTVLTGHLMSDDFFFVKLFPKAIFYINSAKALENPTQSSPNFIVEGILELRGIKKELIFPATVNITEDGDVLIEAHFDIDRTQWNIIYGSSRFFQHLGMHLVYDLISIELRIVLS